jgi:hypothetical protein
MCQAGRSHAANTNMRRLETRGGAPEEISAECVIENAAIKITKELFKDFR